MTIATHSREPIGKYIVPIATWSPTRADADGEFLYIDLSAINRETKSIAGISRVSVADAPSRARQIVQAGDVLISTVRPNLNGVAFVPTEFTDAIASTGFCVLRCDPKRLDNRYLFHWVRTQEFVADMTRKATGASYPAISDRVIKESEIPLPPLPEQQRIADILDKADEIRRNRRLILGTLRDLPRRLFFEMFGNVVLNQRNCKRVAVSEAGDVQLGRQRSPKYQTGNFTRPYLRVANVFDDRIDLTDVLSMDFDERDHTTYRLAFGDILLNEGQSTELVGRAAMWRDDLPDCCFQNTLIRFRANPKITNPEFALAVFREYFYRRAFARVSSKTSSVAHLGASRFIAMPFPLPPWKEQTRFSEINENVRKATEVTIRANDETHSLFKSIIDRAFRGEL